MLTVATAQVLRALLDAGPHGTYGLDIATSTGLGSGTVHPILARLSARGMARAHWEQPDPLPLSKGRPLRRYYVLTPDGRALARHALDRLAQVGRVADGLAEHPDSETSRGPTAPHPEETR